MYKEHFGFTSSPFSIAPDPRYLYMSDRHREALAHLLYGIRSDSGFVLLTGEVGTGKTTICRCLLEQIPDDTDIAFILNPKVTVEELLATICEEFGLNLQGNHYSIKVFVDLINEFLICSHSGGRKAVLIIDEAQNLSVDVLEQIRLLTNLETNERKLLQIIMLGQPELKDMLLQPELRQLAQRITARYHLDPLNEREVRAYVAHRLAVAGGRSKIFPATTINLLYQLTRGTPRLINTVCDRALLGAYVQDQDQVNNSTLRKAAHEVLGDVAYSPRQKTKLSPWAMAAMALLLCGAIFITAFYYQKPLIETLFGHKPIEQAEALEKFSTATQEDVGPQVVPERIAVQPIAPDDLIRQGDNGDEMASSDQSYPVEMAEQVAVIEQMEPPVAVTAVHVQKESDESDSQTQSLELSPLVWPDDISMKESRDLAYKALFDTWGIPYVPDKSTSPCKVAESYSLRCLNQQGSLDSLLQLNRPAVLTFYNDNGEPFFATLTAVQSQMSTLVIGHEIKTVNVKDIGTHWFGEYSILWVKPQEYTAAIKPGNTSANVHWLDKKLALIQGRSPSFETPVRFDDALASQVKQFQFSRNLVPDGIVGPQTIIHLNSVCGYDVPILLTDPQEDN